MVAIPQGFACSRRKLFPRQFLFRAHPCGVITFRPFPRSRPQLPFAPDNQHTARHHQCGPAQHPHQWATSSNRKKPDAQRQQHRGIIKRRHDRDIGIAIGAGREQLRNSAQQSRADQQRGLARCRPDPTKGNCQSDRHDAVTENQNTIAFVDSVTTSLRTKTCAKAAQTELARTTTAPNANRSLPLSSPPSRGDRIIRTPARPSATCRQTKRPYPFPKKHRGENHHQQGRGILDRLHLGKRQQSEPGKAQPHRRRFQPNRARHGPSARPPADHRAVRSEGSRAKDDRDRKERSKENRLARWHMVRGRLDQCRHDGQTT